MNDNKETKKRNYLFQALNKGWQIKKLDKNLYELKRKIKKNINKYETNT